MDLLVLDLRMPKLDGLTVAHRVRAQATTAHVPIVVMTASLTPEECAELKTLGITDHLLKPVGACRLVQRMDAVLGLAPLPEQENTVPEKIPHPPAESDRVPIFDREAAAADLSADPADPAQGQALLTRLCEVFFADLPQQLCALRAAVDAGDISTAQNLGHALKNSAGTLHALRLRAAGMRMEQASSAQLAQALNDIELCTQQLLVYWREKHSWPTS